MNSNLSNKLLKYLANAVVIYILFKYVPKTPMGDQDILIFTAIIIVAYAVFDNLSSLYLDQNSSNSLMTVGQCNTYCTQNNSEHMTNLEPLTQIDNQSATSNLSPLTPTNQSSNLTPLVTTNTVSFSTPIIHNPNTTPIPRIFTAPAINQPIPVQNQEQYQMMQEQRQQSSQMIQEQRQQMTQENWNKINQENSFNPNQQQNVTLIEHTYSPQTRSEGITQVGPDSWTFAPPVNPQIIANGSRQQLGVLGNEMPYTDYNNMPMVDLNPNTGSFETGYSMLPPSAWYPVPPHPPVCVAERSCPVCPVTTTGYGVNLLEWDNTRRVMPADTINVKYVEDKLNSGR